MTKSTFFETYYFVFLSKLFGPSEKDLECKLAFGAALRARNVYQILSGTSNLFVLRKSYAFQKLHRMRSSTLYFASFYT